jgi:hypothetical protein
MHVLLARYPKVQWIVRVHSKSAFIAHEGMAMEWITDYLKLSKKHKNLLISSNNQEFEEELSEVTQSEIVYLPNVYRPTNLERLPIKKFNPETIDVGCFGAIRPLKNHLVQGMAAIQFGNRINKKIRFHVNAGRIEQQGESVLRNLRAIFRYTNHELVEHGWMPHTQFLKLARLMDIGMQVSLSESFNIVAADMVIEDVPVVVSHEINWIPWIFRSDPQDGEGIVRRLLFVYRCPKWIVTTLNKCALYYSNFVNTKIWLRFLDTYNFSTMDKRAAKKC